MESVTPWTARRACALQQALRLSNELFAIRLGVGRRTVAAWHQKPTLRPNSQIQQRLDKTLEESPPPVKERFTQLVADIAGSTDAPLASDHGLALVGPPRDQAAVEAETRLSTDPTISEQLEWLDRHAGWEPGTSRRKVASWLGRLDVRDLQDRAYLRGRIDQREIARSLIAYYNGLVAPYGTYRARYGNNAAAATSILTCTDWLDIDCLLGSANDRLSLVSAAPDDGTAPDELTAEQSVMRLAEILATGTRLINTPLYRLLKIDVRHGLIAGNVGLVPFARYALTMDLLESELVDALAQGESAQPGSLTLRDKYLPDAGTVIDVGNRLCCGGGLALCAIARPPAAGNDAGDYLLLVQERSGQVLNAARRLAVIPKGFHEPLVDYRADAQIGATLKREMEEELFGRDDVDSTAGELRSADPMHSSRLSEPLQWLLADTSRLRIECTGFGLNLVSGNCEFAGLIVIDDEEFWTRYGGHIGANWESGALRRYSSLDRDLVTELIGDVAWSNEGLFAFLQGLRRLSEIGGGRVDLPTIEWEIQQ